MSELKLDLPRPISFSDSNRLQQSAWHSFEKALNKGILTGLQASDAISNNKTQDVINLANQAKSIDAWENPEFQRQIQQRIHDAGGFINNDKVQEVLSRRPVTLAENEIHKKEIELNRRKEADIPNVLNAQKAYLSGDISTGDQFTSQINTTDGLKQVTDVRSRILNDRNKEKQFTANQNYKDKILNLEEQKQDLKSKNYNNARDTEIATIKDKLQKGKQVTYIDSAGDARIKKVDLSKQQQKLLNDRINEINANKIGNTPPLQSSQKDISKSVYSALKEKGFNENVKRAFYANIGRETSFLPKNVSGTTVDPHNKAENLGLINYQGSRGKAFRKAMADKGFYNANTKALKTSPASIKAQIDYMLNDIQTNYPELAKKLSNNEIGFNEATKLLGKDYIKWRIDDPKYAKTGKANEESFGNIYDSLSSTPNTSETTATDIKKFIQDDPTIASKGGINALRLAGYNLQDVEDKDKGALSVLRTYRKGKVAIPIAEAKADKQRKNKILQDRLNSQIGSYTVRGDLNKAKRDLRTADLESNVDSAWRNLPGYTSMGRSLLHAGESTREKFRDLLMNPSANKNLEKLVKSQTNLSKSNISLSDFTEREKLGLYKKTIEDSMSIKDVSMSKIMEMFFDNIKKLSELRKKQFNG